jgi:ABC-type glutathione transport system ATPase component
MGVIAGRTDRVVVMYAGRVAEEAETGELFSRIRHPYSEALLASVPKLDQRPLVSDKHWWDLWPYLASISSVTISAGELVTGRIRNEVNTSLARAGEGDGKGTE